jgi:predicted nucleic acid-binding protein
MFEDPVDPPRVVADDANDDYLVALAIESVADLIVTRDRHFDEVRMEGLRILAPGRLLRELGER